MLRLKDPRSRFVDNHAALLIVCLAASALGFMLMLAMPSIEESVFGLYSSSSAPLHIVGLRLLMSWVTSFALFSLIVFGPKCVGRFLHAYRFKIGALIVACAVILNISGSSLGMWNFWLGHDMSVDVVWGTPRPIRTDEYIVGTPLAFAQGYTGYGYFNSLFGNRPADMFLIKDAPVWTLAEIFRPFHWGYLLFGSDRGLAFYWSSRLVALFLASYELLLMVCNMKGEDKHKGVAGLGASFISFAPLVQWWFAVNSLPEMLIAVFVSIVCFDRYLGEERTLIRPVYAAAIFLCAGIFILSLYPAWQIPLAYLLVVLIVYVLVRHWGKIRFSIKDVTVLGVELVVFCIVLASVFVMSWDTIQTTMHTVYPGSRQSTGGGLNPLSLVTTVCTLFLPFKEWISVPGVEFSNPTEVSAFVDLFPVGIVLAIIQMIRQKRADVLNACLIGIIMFFTLFACVGFPLWLSRLLFLTPVTASRIVVVFGIANIILLVRSASQIDRCGDARVTIAVVLVYAVAIALITHYTYSSYVGRLLTFGCFAIICVMTFSFIVIRREIITNGAIVLSVIGMMVSGLSVNPIQYGSAPLTQQPLTQQVQALQSKNEGMWVTDGDDSARLANLLVANGAKTLNALAVVPDMKTWRTLDTSGKMENVYNRYAFISVQIQTDEASEPFELNYGDAFTLHVTPAQLRKLGVSNVLSTQKLDQMTFDGYVFKAIGKTIDGRTPYRIVKQ